MNREHLSAPYLHCCWTTVEWDWAEYVHDLAYFPMFGSWALEEEQSNTEQCGSAIICKCTHLLDEVK